MGSRIWQIIPGNIKKKITIQKLIGKRIAVDGANLVVRYLLKIRKNNEILVNRVGFPIAHLIGIGYFIANVYKYNIKAVMVFDGTENELKHPKVAKRTEFAQRYIKIPKIIKENTLVLYKYVIESSTEFVKLTGLPVIIAPSDAEAQGAVMCAQGQVEFIATNDYDALLFGAPAVIRNLNFSSKEMEVLLLQDVLSALNLTQEQLIDLAILAGTDYNPKIKGIGINKALKLIKKYEAIDNIPEIREEQKKRMIMAREVFTNPAFIKRRFFFTPPIGEALKRFLINSGLSSKKATSITESILKNYKSHIKIQTTLI
ncbi:MAG: hypothetical protein J7L47_01235 [Candidatus Odinarchaeota archaeon]|nr:hypothetical protein [Candidatus Odinarchaeota archaeon]